MAALSACVTVILELYVGEVVKSLRAPVLEEISVFI